MPGHIEKCPGRLEIGPTGTTISSIVVQPGKLTIKQYAIYRNTKNVGARNLVVLKIVIQYFTFYFPYINKNVRRLFPKKPETDNCFQNTVSNDVETNVVLLS